MKYNLFFLGIFILIAVFVAGTRPPQQQPNTLEPNTSEEDLLLQLPQVEVVGTVTRVTLDPNTNCENTCPAYEYPKDTITLQISQVLNTEATYSGLTLPKVGDTFDVSLFYSARPAEIVPVRGEEVITGEGDSATVSFTPPETKPATFKNNTFSYQITALDEGNTTITLPGLKVGDRIQAKLTLTSPESTSMGEYTLVQ